MSLELLVTMLVVGLALAGSVWTVGVLSVGFTAGYAFHALNSGSIQEAIASRPVVVPNVQPRRVWRPPDPAPLPMPPDTRSDSWDEVDPMDETRIGHSTAIGEA